eukprot:scaffold111634_cov45-Phaeocystis_antarctica.AAC.4
MMGWTASYPYVFRDTPSLKLGEAARQGVTRRRPLAGLVPAADLAPGAPRPVAGCRAGGCPCPVGTSYVRTLHARRPPRGRTRAASGRARPRLQTAARQAAEAAARPGSGHQGGPRGAGGPEGRERGCQGRRRRTSRCRRGRHAFARGAEPRLHRLLPAAVRYGRRA